MEGKYGWGTEQRTKGEWVRFLQRPISRSLRARCNRKQDAQLTREDHQAQFYEDYRREAEWYDREFMKKHEEDLNTTLIFVSFVLLLLGPRIYTGRRLVYSPLLLPPLSSRSTPSSGPTEAMRPLPSSVSSSTR